MEVPIIRFPLNSLLFFLPHPSWPITPQKGTPIQASFLSPQNYFSFSLFHRVAVVTGGNKGIGLEIVRQLALQGVTVVLTARDEQRGRIAASSLCSPNVVFHLLDVRDSASVTALSEFLSTNFGKLDILVNNAGHSGVTVDAEALRALNIDPHDWLSGAATETVRDVVKGDFDAVVACLDTNYFGCKRVTEGLLPLLKLSEGGASIVNVSSLRSELKRIPSESIRKELGELDGLTEEKIEGVLQRFLEDMKSSNLDKSKWCAMLPAYSISKAALNAYTRVLARRYPAMKINCVHPGFVKTDLNWHTGVIPPCEGAQGPVFLAMLPPNGPSGCYFDQCNVSSF